MSGRGERQAPDLQRRVRELADRRAVVETIQRLDRLLDEKRFEDLPSVYAEGFQFYSRGALITGLDELIAFGARRHADFAAQQHVSANVRVEIDGDRATARVNAITAHVAVGAGPETHHASGVAHEFELVRTPAGWRIARLDGPLIWTRSEPEDHR